MSNMSYCRWQNTYLDLLNCFEHLEDTGLNASENTYRSSVLELAASMLYEIGIVIDKDELEKVITHLEKIG